MKGTIPHVRAHAPTDRQGAGLLIIPSRLVGACARTCGIVPFMAFHRRVPALVLVLALIGVAVSAQQVDRARALDEQIGRIFESNEYQPPRFGPARWLPDGTAYTIVELSAERPGASDIV